MDEFHQLGGSCSSRLPFSFSSSPASSAAAPLPPAAAGTSFFCELMSANRNPGPAKLEPGSVFQYPLHDTDQYSMKGKIVSHPHYPALLAAYIDCQKVGAPPEVAARLSAVAGELQERQQAGFRRVAPAAADPELDQFMEAYCNMLVKYKEELGRPLQDAMDYLRKVESQLSSLTNGAAASFLSSSAAADEKLEEVLSSEEDHDSGAEAEVSGIDPRSEDREIKLHLLKKYSGYLGSLRQELSKKRKKGKLPKDARQKLLNWWELHYKWPYPSETEKLALAESTGLDQKQINNWFINQRKRHWKPSEDMQFVVMDSFHPQNAAALYMGGQFLADGNYRFGL